MDNDPMVLAHSRALKTGGNTAVIEADLRDPETILNHPGTRTLIDFGQPLAVLLVAVLHFVSDNDDPHAVVAAIRDALPGSFLVVSHAASGIRRDPAVRVAEHYRKNVTAGATLRGRDEILRFFTGLDLVDPGLIQVPYWRPDDPAPTDADRVWFLGAVGRRPDADGE